MQVTVILKPTYQCQFRCRHCSIGDRKYSGFKASLSDICSYMERFFEFLAVVGINVSCLEVIWHGGEPMLMGPDFYFRVKEKLDLSFPHVEFIHGIQTNLMFYVRTVAWSEVFRNIFGYRVGTSYDFFAKIRPYSEEDFLRVYEKFLSDGARPGIVITMVTKENMYRIGDIFALARDFCFYPKYNNVYFAGEARVNVDLVLDMKDYTKAIRDSIRFSKSLGIPSYPYKYFLECVSDFGRRFRCPFNSMCFDSVFHITPYGDLYKCAVYSDLGFPSYGNLLKDSIFDIARRYARHKISAVSSIPDDCLNCGLFHKCGGGCVAYRESFGSMRLKSPYCDVTKLLYNEAFNESCMGVPVC